MTADHRDRSNTPADSPEERRVVDPDQTIDPFETLKADSGSEADRLRRVLHGDLSEFDSGNFSHVELSRVKTICDRFNREWTVEDVPNVADFISDDMGEHLRHLLVRDLVRADIAQRRRHNRRIEPADYLRRLSKYRFSIESAWWSHLFELSRTGIPASTQPVRPVPSRTPRYRPLKLHARGGLGAVYRARDEELGRTVALKEIRRDRASDVGNQARFVFEAEVTGSLEHPGIVPVYGFGRYRDNRPYYAMRFVRGHSFRKAIESFHDSHRHLSRRDFYSLEFRALLRHFVDACNALHYAHEHGVLHRDIKPANIMLGKYGETLVVDWGLAKLISDLPLGKGERVTSTELDISASGTETGHSVVGTPLFMSPEQAAGSGQLTPPSDVYSLGATLFNLITNQYPVEGRSPREILRNVGEGKVREVSSLVPTAPRALGSICRRAMQQDPSRRYAGAAEIAEDVERWLSDERVHAHAGSENLADKTTRLVRRYQSWTISAAAALLLVTFISVSSTVVIGRARSQEQRAHAAATEFKRQAIDRFGVARHTIDQWLAALQFFPATEPIRHRLLDMAVEDYAKLASETSDDPELELERARTLVGCGNIELQRRSLPDAARDFYRQAQQILGSDLGRDLDRVRAAEHANVFTVIGNTYLYENRYAEALAAFRQAEGSLDSLVRQSSDLLATRYLATASTHHGVALMEQGNLDGAADHFQDAIEHFAGVKGQMTAEDRYILARTRQNQGAISVRQGDEQSARGLFDEAAREMESLASQWPNRLDYLESEASMLIDQASVYRLVGQTSLELATMERAVNRYRDLCSTHPDVPHYAEGLAMALTNLGITRLANDATQQAGACLDEAETLLGGLIDLFGYRPFWATHLASCRDLKGQLLLDTRQDPTESIAHLESAIAYLAQVLRDDPENPDCRERIGVAASHLGRAYHRDSRVEPSRNAFVDAASAMEELAQLYPDEPRYRANLAAIYANHGRVLLDQGDVSAAQKLKLARETWLGLGELITPTQQNDLVWLLVTCPVESIRDISVAQRLAEQMCQRAPSNLKLRATQALVQWSAGQPAEAVLTIERIEKDRGFLVGRDLYVLAMTQPDVDQARKSFEAAAQWARENAPFDADLRRLHQLAEQRFQQAS